MLGFFKSKKEEEEKKENSINDDFIYKQALNYGYLVIEIDPDGIIKNVNDNFINLLKTSQIEAEGKPITKMMLVTSKELVDSQKEFREALKFRKKWQGVLRLRSFKNIDVDLIASMTPYIKDNKLKKFIISGTDFTKFSNERRNFYKQFYTDSLTGFANRQKLVDNLEYISRERDSTLILFDIDNFAKINDFFGYNIGDALLKNVANCLNREKPTPNTLFYKLPADSYAMLITEDFDRSKLVKFIKRILEIISNEFFNCSENELNISITIGAAQGKYDLLKHANSALSRAKKELKSFIIYDNDDNQDNIIGQNLHMIQIIKEAINSNRVIPVFQPIVNAQTSRVEKYETLMRIKDEEGSIISPAKFLDISIQAKLYPKLLQEMLDKAFQYYKASNKQFSINFSVDDLLNTQISNSVLKMINRDKLAKRIVIELLESQDIDDYKKLNKILEQYRSFGCLIAIDDFGSGYSNFEHILKLHLDIIKIDGSLIKNLDNDKAAQLLVKTIVSFAKEINLKTVAEYVHSASVFRMVRDFGIDYVQGYFIAPPSEHLHLEKV